MTPRQMEILHLRADGLTVQETADQLGVSFDTVKNTMRRIYAQLRVETLVEALHVVGFVTHGMPSEERGSFKCLFGHRATSPGVSR